MVKPRDYKQERKTLLARGEDKGHAERLRARRAAVSAGKVKPHDGKDLDHKKPLSKGGTTTRSNLTVKSASANRSFARNADHTVKTNKPKNGNTR